MELFLSLTIFEILIAVLGIVVLVLLFLQIRLQKRMRDFLVGKDEKNISESLAIVRKTLGEHSQFEKEMAEYLTSVERRLRASVQHVETVRFNPWGASGGGGNQSFAVALLNEHGTGVVLSSLYTRDRMSVYAKPVQNFVSSFELSEEERGAVTRAQTHSQKKHIAVTSTVLT